MCCCWFGIVCELTFSVVFVLTIALSQLSSSLSTLAQSVSSYDISLNPKRRTRIILPEQGQASPRNDYDIRRLFVQFITPESNPCLFVSPFRAKGGSSKGGTWQSSSLIAPADTDSVSSWSMFGGADKNVNRLFDLILIEN
jgi:hypothetical protein